MSDPSAKVLVAPSILSADFGRLAEEVGAVEQAGADWVHLDVMDGRFVPNITMGPVVVEAVKKATKLPLDVHLMIVEPERYVADFVAAGANVLSVHVEACPHLHRTLQQIRQAGARPGVVLNPATPVSAVEEVLGEVDLVRVMSVNPGFGGQSFIPGAVEKVRRLRRLIEARRLSVEIEVDGGMNEKTAPLVRKAGASVLVAGSFVFGAQSYKKAIATLRR